MRGIIKILLASVAVVAMTPVVSHAQTFPSPRYHHVQSDTYAGATDATTVTRDGSSTPRSLGSHRTDTVNVRDFGAVGDDVHDDTTAINAAIQYVRDHMSIGAAIPLQTTDTHTARIVFPNGQYLITGSINLTGFMSIGIDVEMRGASIDCQATGLPCVDALGSEGLGVHDLKIIGSAVNVPSIGMQIGRITPAVVADNHIFDHIKVWGSFSFAAFYNEAAETTLFDHPEFYNYNGGSNTYGLVQDGYDHFNAASAFQTVTVVPDQLESFNENTFLSADIRATGAGTPIWLGGTARHKFIGSYAAGHGYGAVLYGEGVSQNVMLEADIHFETVAMTDAFFVSGTNTAPFINGFAYSDHDSQPSNSVLKADTNITAITLRNARINIANYHQTTEKLFDNPAIWSVSGEYWDPIIARFNATTFQGPVQAGAHYTWANYGAGAISAQSPDTTAVGGNNRGADAVDWGTTRTTAAQVASGANSVISGGESNTASATDATVLGGSTNIASATTATAGGSGSSAGGPSSWALGISTVTTGNGSWARGNASNDHGNGGADVWANGVTLASGDAQAAQYVMRGHGTGTGAIRPTVNGQAASASNCANIQANSAYTFGLFITAADHTTPGTNYAWSVPVGLAIEDATPSTTVVTVGTPAVVSRGTVTGAAVAVTADTTNGCPSITFTPPTGNTTDVWDVVARLQTVETR